jgi:hypothetical protein
MKKFRDCSTTELLAIDAGLDYYDLDLVAEICDRAGLSEAYAAADGDSSADGGETFESVYYRALEILENEEGL